MLKKAYSLLELSIVIVIVGVLIAGVTVSVNLIKKSKFAAARSLTELSPVVEIPNLALWVETTSAKSFDDAAIEDGTTVTTWYDLNSQAVNRSTIAGQGSSAIYTKNAINGLPALKFSGADGSYYLVTHKNLSSNGLKTIFVVLQTLVGGSKRHYIFDNDACCTQNAFIINGSSVNGQYYAGASVSPPNITSTQNYIFTIVANGSNSIVRANGTATTGNAGSNAMSTLTHIGSAVSGGSSGECLNGYLGEFIIYDRVLRTEEYKTVEAYLSKKWGIGLN